MVFDCTTFFNELDLLEIRLNILDPYVDFFVIGESKQTFSGKEKELLLPKAFYYDDRFRKFAHKVLLQETEVIEAKDAFERAFYQKEKLKSWLNEKAKDDDVVYFGDLDEIWTPQDITDDKVYNLEQLNYCYFLNQRSSERWVGTIVGRWKTIKENTFSYWRATHTYEVHNAGWHFTNMGGVDQIRKKLDSYDHQEFNNESIKADIEMKILLGEDYVGRATDWEGKPFEMWIDETDLPKYIVETKQTWKHLLK